MFLDSTTFLSFRLLYDVTTLGSCDYILSMTANLGRGLLLFVASVITIASMKVKVNIRRFAGLVIQLRMFPNRKLPEQAWIAAT